MSLFSIRAVSKKTGLSTHLIRIWEKRYQAITPTRLPSGHRRYTETEILRLSLLGQLTQFGHKISDIGHLPTHQLENLLSQKKINQLTNHSDESTSAEHTQEYFIEQSIEAIKKNDKILFENLILSILSHYSQWKALDQFLAPLLKKIGYKWRIGEFSLYHEHFASQVIESILSSAQYKFALHAEAPRLLLATPPGYDHTLGLAMGERVAYLEGWNVINLGAKVPPLQIAEAAKKFKVDVIGLSLVFPFNDPGIIRQLELLKRMTPDEIEIIIGGMAANQYWKELKQLRINLIPDLETFRSLLLKKQSPRSNEGSGQKAKIQARIKNL